MRDHYYQLWDLEKNFGEKRYCDNQEFENSRKSFKESIMRLGISSSTYKRGFNKNSTTLFERFDSEISRGKKDKPPKGTDIYGIGTESSPIGFLSSDCCKTVDNRRTRRNAEEELGRNGLPRFNCANARITINGVEQDGGDCKMMDVYTPGESTTGLQDGSWRGQKEFFAKIENKFLNPSKFNYANLYGWTPEVYFKWPSKGQWTPGFGCSKMRTGREEGPEKVTARKIWDESIPGDDKWRIITHADRLCYRQDTSTDTGSETLGDTTATESSCAVPDHSGPLAEGKVQYSNHFFSINCFEANSKYHADTPSRHKPGVNDGDIDSVDFGKWFDFANCLKSTLEILEGQAHYPEAKNLKTSWGEVSVKWDEKPYIDDGSTAGNEITDDVVLAGLEIGSSKTSKIRQKSLWNTVNNGNNGFQRFHGAGTRFIENPTGANSILSKCEKFIPDGEKTSYEIKPDFDTTQTLMGYYEMNDFEQEINQNSVHKLIVNDDGKYRNPRKIMKYYKQPYSLNGFIPRY
ncbi:unnamed protein product [Oikopleura dioica]|uniref:Uncharacterized protein n=1 Tax=Oikopleura dioica TaxID=34765 RepID=E4XR33_OIKDI|nr:unnamed protein product [Oikopleura dioica]